MAVSDIMTFDRVQKNFAAIKALQDVSFSIPANTIFGLLGPNGAGKTTLIRIITRIFAPDGGEVVYNGRAMESFELADIGYMPEEKGMYKKMKVGEHLIYLARLKGMPKKVAREKIQHWLDKLQAGDWWNKKIEDLSKGMQQKVQFISTVIHEPKLLILDEPFSGLDPVNADMIKNEIYQLHERGTTILFSTHRMEQVEEICDSIVLINKGKVIISGNVKEIKMQFREHKYILGFDNEITLESNAHYNVLERKENNFIIQLHENIKRNSVLQQFTGGGNDIVHFEEIYPSLHDIFIKLVNADNHA